MNVSGVKSETWIVTDGRAGMLNQARGLAEAVGLPVVSKTVHPRFPWTMLPVTSWPAPTLALGPESARIEPPWPRLLIGCGWRSIPYSIEVRRRSASGTMTVQLQDPRVATTLFDLVVPPEHDGLTGPNVVPMIGSPNAVTPTKLAAAASVWTKGFDHLPRPLVAVLIGGKSKSHRFGPQEASALTAQLMALDAAGFGLMVTLSRRTGEPQAAIIRDALARTGAFVWNGDGENPYFGMLALADAILVTSDSTNMAVEAAATGKPVHVVALPCSNAKFETLHARLRELGIARNFTGSIGSWTYEPLRETQRIAGLIRGKLGFSSPVNPA